MVFLGNIESILVNLIVKNFVETKKKLNRKKTINKKPQNFKFSSSTFLINSETKKIKNENKEKKSEKEALEETAEEESEDKKEIIVNGGYGTVSKHYGISPSVKYTDYNKIWGYLGTFRTYNMHENNESSNEIAIKNGEITTMAAKAGDTPSTIAAKKAANL